MKNGEVNNQEDTLIAVEKQRRVKPPVCSDYDADCSGVKSPLACFIGVLPHFKEDGMIYYTPMADGICPLMNKGA